MCGIAGMVDFRGRAVDRDILQRMQDTLAHRGPDDQGTWIHESQGFSVGLAHCRLAVIDPTPEAHQPMLDPTGRFAINYNGELYKYRELGERLHNLHTASDTEVMLQACIQWGPDALRQLDGMWAMAFVDVGQRSGHLSRDPFGIKPLYYLLHDGRLWFASELRTLNCIPDWPRDVSSTALADYLALGFIPHPDTIYSAVRKLPPGHRLDFTTAGAGEPICFYELPAAMSVPMSYSEACGELRKKIERTVATQRVADVPLGAFLSGGLDSSIVVAALARAGGTVRTFSIGYADHGRYDETAYARKVAEHFGTQHQEFRLSFADVLATIEPMLNHLGEPFADSSLLPTALVSQYTRQHVTVALSGDGGDELFGGYWRYLGHHYLRQYQRMPMLVRKWLIEPLVRRLPPGRASGWLNRVRQIRKLIRPSGAAPTQGTAMDRHLNWSRLAGEQDLTALLGWDVAADTGRRLLERFLAAAPAHADDLQRILRADLAISLPADMLHKVDTASMYHSLEVRVPLLGREVVEFAARLPIEYKILNARGKRILRDAFADILPADILNRPKMGFEVPIADFLRDELAEMYGDTVRPEMLNRLGIDPAAAEQLRQQHVNRREDHSGLLWGLLVLCWWASRSG